MKLSKIQSEDLLFTYELMDDRVNTYLKLDDFDWMNYELETKFRTEEMGELFVTFQYFGMVTSTMEVLQELNGSRRRWLYEYSTDIFQKYITRYLAKHIIAWEEEIAFYGEDEVIDFYNEVLDEGVIIEEDKMFV